MKRFVILAFLFIGTATAYRVNEAWHAIYLEATSDAVQQCSKELNVNPDILVKHTTDDSIDKKQVGCLYACVFKKIGTMVDEKLVEDKSFDFAKKVPLKSPAQVETLKKIVTDCIQKANTVEDVCMKSLSYVDCFYTNTEKSLS